MIFKANSATHLPSSLQLKSATCAKFLTNRLFKKLGKRVAEFNRGRSRQRLQKQFDEQCYGEVGISNADFHCSLSPPVLLNFQIFLILIGFVCCRI